MNRFAIAVVCTTCSVFAQLPDLVVSKLNTSAVATDGQTLQVSGVLSATIVNQGAVPSNGTFKVLAFEDKNANGRYDALTDAVLASALWTGGIPTGGSAAVALPLSGKVTFRGNLIYVMADSDGIVSELSELNNYRHTGQSVPYLPPIGQFSPRLKWSWVSSSILPDYRQVMVTPMVANLNDDNGDGLINELDYPDVIFQCAKENPYLGFNGDGVIRAVDGRDGRELFTVSDPTLRVVPYAALAVADLDGDGKPEIIAPAWRDLIILRNDGTLKYRSDVMYWEAKVGSVGVADLDGDGFSEILWGPDIFSHQGRLVRRASFPCGYGNRGWGPMSFMADIDLDGIPEVIDGGSAYSQTGQTKFCFFAGGGLSVGGWSAVGNLDADPMAEIVFSAAGWVFAFEHDGSEKWRVSHPGGGILGPPTIADFDGDGEPEIGVAGYSQYAVYEKDGTLKWSSPISDYSSSMTGSSVFDFEGDGKAEVIYNDEQKLRVYEGATGRILFETANPNATGTEYPVIVDVDRDGHAEIVVSRNVFGDPTIGTSGIFVYGDPTWVSTRTIWNQHAYSVTNINDDATVPRRPLNNWLTPGLNNFRLNSFPDPQKATYAPDLIPSFLRKLENSGGTQLIARIGNGGAASSGSRPSVSFYRGDPTSGGTLLATIQATKALLPGEWEDVAVNWPSAPAGQHPIVVVADAGNVIVEGDETNNKTGANLLIGIGPQSLVDGLITRFKDRSVDLSWPTIQGASSYRVYRRTGTLPLQLVRSGITGTVFTDTGLVNGTVYYYAVRWLNAQGQESGDGTEASATPTPLGATAQNPPTISSRPLTRALAGQPYSYQLRATDPDAGEVLTCALITPPTGMTINGAGLIQWLPNSSQAGYSRVFVQVTDKTGRIATQSYQLFTEVQVVNTPPLITSSPTRSASSGSAYAYQAIGMDPDGGFLVWALDSAPSGLSVNPNTGLINWSPSRSQVGTQTVALRATDFGGLFATQSFAITVARGNKAPVFTTAPVTIARVAQAYVYQLVISDPDGDPVTFVLQSAPSGMTINGKTGMLSWTPTTSQMGPQGVSVKATDDGGLGTVQNFTISVSQANRAPVITSTAPTSAEVSRAFSYQVIASDPDAGDVLTYSLLAAPAGMTIVGGNGLIQWTPTTAQGGTTQSATVRATDLAGASFTQAFSVQVRPLDTTRPLTDILTPTSGSEVGTDFTITGTVTDDNLTGWTLEFQPLGAPNWTTLKTGTTSVTNATLATFPATILANDIYRIRLRGQDAGGETSDEIEVLVNTNQLKMGDFTLSFEDVRVPGFTFPISILRKYDTKRLTPSDFGVGWTLGFSEVDLRLNANYDVFLTLPDGRRVRFNHTPVSIGIGVFNTAFTGQAGVYDTLENLDCPQVFGSPGNFLCSGFLPWSPQNFRLTTKDGVKYTINKLAGIQRIEDRAGNFIAISPTGVTSNFGRNVTFQRDGSGRITQIVDPIGGTLRYEYDATGRLIRFLDQSGNPTTFFYENSSFPSYLTKLVDPLGRPVTRNVYNADGRLIGQCDANGDIVTLTGCVRFDPQVVTRLFSAVNGRGFRTDLLLDAQGNVTSEKRYLDATTSLETLRTYDANNNLLTERDPAGNIKSFTYDSRGNKLTDTDTGGRTRTYTYDACNKVLTDRDPAGNTSTYTYNAQCNLRFVRDALNNTTEYRYSAAGQRTHFIDPVGNTWIWSYATNGLLISLTDPFGKQTTFTFDNSGDLLSRVDRNGRRIDFMYDPSHRLQTERWATGRTVTFGYNIGGQLTSAVDPDSALTMTYDTVGRLLNVDNVGTPGAPRVVMTYGYDANGNVTQVGDSLGGVTGYQYDQLDRLSRVTQSGTGVQEKRVDMLYDTASMLTEMRRFGNLAGTLAVANTRYEYDCGGCSGRVTAMRHRKASDNSVIHDLTFTRDVLGNITQMTDAEGNHTYTYDNIRRLLTATHSNPALQPNEFYTYDPAGNRITSHLSHFYSYSYQTSGKGSRLLQDNQFNYLYDDEGNQVRRTDRATGSYTEYVYDFRNRMTSAIQKTAAGVETGRAEYGYDALNRRLRALEAGQTAWFGYDGLNPALKLTASSAITSRRAYSRGLDSILADEAIATTRWFLTDQVASTRDLVSNSSTSISHYAYDSFGRTLLETNPASANDLLFAGREFNRSTNLGYFRARFFDPTTGRFTLVDPLPPYSYEYSSNNPGSFKDPMGLLSLPEYALLAQPALFATRAYATAKCFSKAGPTGSPSNAVCLDAFLVGNFGSLGAVAVTSLASTPTLLLASPFIVVAVLASVVLFLAPEYF